MEGEEHGSSTENEGDATMAREATTINSFWITAVVIEACKYGQEGGTEGAVSIHLGCDP